MHIYSSIKHEYVFSYIDICFSFRASCFRVLVLSCCKIIRKSINIQFFLSKSCTFAGSNTKVWEEFWLLITDKSV